MIQTQENGKKNPHFGPDLGPNFFFKFFFSVARYHGQLSSCTISERTNDLILRKLSNGRMDEQMDGQTDGKMD